MLGHPEKLCDFLGQLADYKAPADEKIELILNGDFVDFLAIEPFQAWTPDESACVEKLNKAEQQFPQVFDAFRRCIARTHYFTITLGNHDIETALPRVTDALLDKLGTSLKSCEFLRTNQAYRVGDLLVEHGNRYDSWNAIDHGALQRVASAHSRLETPPLMDPCPGSFMVEKLVNSLREEYPFLDLLKPENKILSLVLFALEPSLKRDLRRFTQFSRFFVAQWARTRTWLPRIASAAEELISAPDMDTSLPGPLRTAFQDQLTAFDEEEISSLGELLNFKKRIRQESMAQLIRDEKPLPADRLHKLRLALAAALQGDRTFDLDGPDGPYLEAARRMIGDGTSTRPCVVAMGHTHLRKHVTVGSAGHYINTGTWVDLIRISPTLLESESPIEPFEEWIRQAVLDVEKLRFSDPAFADVTLDDDGILRQPGNRPLLREYGQRLFGS